MAEDPMLQMATQAQQRARETKREEIISTSPTAQYMQARIEVLTKMLIRRFGDILEVAINPPPKPDGSEADPPSLVDTANKQLTVDTATMSLIRAAEELMVLTRTMKELWLLGGLDTLVTDSEGGIEKAKEVQDEDSVVRGLLQWLEKNGGRFARVQEDKSHEGEGEGEEVEEEDATQQQSGNGIKKEQSDSGMDSD